MKKVLTIVSIIGSGVTSVLAQGIVVGSQAAGSTANGGALLSFLALAQTFINRLVPFAIGIAVLGFFWFIIQFIWMAKDNPDAQNKAKTGIMWSLIALFCIVCVWGIIQLLASILGIGLGGSAQQFKLPGEL